MPDEISADRVLANAVAARVELAPEDAERIARAVRPVVTRFVAAAIEIPMEAEPATFLAVQRRELAL